MEIIAMKFLLDLTWLLYLQTHRSAGYLNKTGFYDWVHQIFYHWQK